MQVGPKIDTAGSSGYSQRVPMYAGSVLLASGEMGQVNFALGRPVPLVVFHATRVGSEFY
jgi:hypothetical protein